MADPSQSGGGSTNMASLRIQSRRRAFGGETACRTRRESNCCVRRDLKPANIRAKTGAFKVLDFR
jgi:hypothetical protein